MTALERRTVISLALLYSFRMLGLFMVLPLLAIYAADMPGATPALIGLALGIYGLSQALLQIPLGWLSDWVGRKPVIVGGLVLFALGSLIAGSAETVHGLVAGRCLQGAGAIASSVMALAADLTREDQRTKAMALIGISIGMSFSVAFIIGPAIAAVGGLSAVFQLTAAMGVVGIAIVLLLVPTPPRIPRSPVEGGLPGAPAHSEVGARLALIPRSLTEPALMRLNVGVFVLHFILMSSFLLVPGFLEGIAEVPRADHWHIYLPVMILSILGMVPMLIAAERGGRQREMFLLGICMLLLALVAIGFTAHPYMLYLGLLLFFIAFNYMEAALPSQVSKLVFAGGKGTALGVYSTSQFLGAFAGGGLGGWLLQTYGNHVMLGLSLLLLVLWLLLVLMPQQRVPEPRELPDAR
jgi:MFS family permease